jgi:hypothetical protein
MSEDNQTRNTEIRAFKAAGWTLRDIGEKFGLNPGHVGRIVKHATPIDDPQEASKMLELQDGKAWARKRLREGLRNENVITRCAEIAVTETAAFEPVKVPKFKKRTAAVQETLVAVMSDGHHDQVVRAEEVNGLENYTFPVSCRRGEQWVDTLIRFAKHTLVGYDFPELVVLSLGDSTSGEIHDAERTSAFGNQFKNTLAIGALHASMYRELAAVFPKVTVVCTSGNHGRRTDRKEYKGGAHNNWDYMVNKVAQTHLNDQSNVSFIIPNSWDVIQDIRGYGFHCSHGDDVASNGSNPWIGLKNLHKTNSGIHRGTGQSQPFRGADAIDYYCIGHHHTQGIVDGNGCGFICNGAWLGTDAYAYQSMRVAGRPQQVIFGVHKDHGKTWTLPIHLDGRDAQKRCRYDGILNSIDGLDYCLNAPRVEGTWA